MEQSHTFEALGTRWKITLYDIDTLEKYHEIIEECVNMCISFDNLYSRFKEDSLVSIIAKDPGTYTVPKDFVNMLRTYTDFYLVSEKKFTPCIGGLLEDIGYDSKYSLVQKESLRSVPSLEDAVTIIDDTTIVTHVPVVFDFGALGKGYCIDLLVQFLRSRGVERFLVDGSGDIFYEAKGIPITVGLEHPHDETKVIGTIDMKSGSMCSSATNRRAWGKYSHYIDPSNNTSPATIIATWVIAESAALADALSSVLFFVAPEDITAVNFSYCIMNHEYKVKRSPDFSATFY